MIALHGFQGGGCVPSAFGTGLAEEVGIDFECGTGARMTARSRTFCSSRTLPGRGYDTLRRLVAYPRRADRAGGPYCQWPSPCWWKTSTRKPPGARK